MFAVAMSKWWCWDGAYTNGNRMMSDTLPILGMGLAYWIERVRETTLRIRVTAALGLFSVVTFSLLTYVVPRPITRDLVLNLSEGPWGRCGRTRLSPMLWDCLYEIRWRGSDRTIAL